MDLSKNNKKLNHNKSNYPIDSARRELINQEQPKVDSVAFVYDPYAPQSNLKPEVMQQYDQAKEPSKDSVKLRNYKKRQIQDYTNEFSMSQIAPSPMSAFLNVVNTIILTLALIIAFMVSFGLLFGLKIGIVPTDSMEPKIHVGAMVVIKPLNDISEIRVGDALSYVKKDSDGSFKKYIHEVESVAGNVITMVGANPKYTNKDQISFDAVEGRMVLNLPGLGYVVAFVKNNLLIILPALIVLIIALMLTRAIIDKKHNTAQISAFLEKKSAYEQKLGNELIEKKKNDEQQKLEEILKKPLDDSNVDNFK